MSASTAFSKNIESVEIHGLRGRMLDLPARTSNASKINLLFLHGHHSSIERQEGLLTLLSSYGNVCAPDMPGFGGMEPLFRINKKPSIDQLAEYMATFIRLHYGTRKRFVAIGFSFGFVVLTRMLQLYPELQPRVTLTVSVVGFLSGQEFVFTKRRMLFYRFLCWALGFRVTSFLVRELVLRRWFLGTIYTQTKNAKVKFKNLSKEVRKKYVDFEIHLWRANDLRTHVYTNAAFLTCNLLKEKAIASKLVHVVFSADQYFNAGVVAEHLKIAYTDVQIVYVESDSHAPSVVSDENEAALLFPKKLRRILGSLQ